MPNSDKPEKTILIVDANVNRRSNLATKFRIFGHRTEVCSSGFQVIHFLEQAIEKKNKAYSTLVIYEDSEDMSGREIILLARNIHKDKAKFTIFYINDVNDPEEILETIKDGANEYIIDIGNQTKVIDKVRKSL